MKNLRWHFLPWNERMARYKRGESRQLKYSVLERIKKNSCAAWKHAFFSFLLPLVKMRDPRQLFKMSGQDTRGYVPYTKKQKRQAENFSKDSKRRGLPEGKAEPVRLMGESEMPTFHHYCADRDWGQPNTGSPV
jgi:hypothetical protein